MPATKKTKAPANAAIFAVVGSDESEVKRRAAQLAGELLAADASEFGRDVIDGCADNAEQAAARIHETIQALLTLPFFGSEKLVWLKSANFLADSVTGRSATVLDALEALQSTLNEGLPDGVKFLLSAIDVDKRRGFYKSLSKLGKVEVFDKIDSTRSGWEEEVAPVVAQRASERGLRMSGETLEIFTMLTGGDSRTIDNELEKLDLFLGAQRRDVSEEDVRLLVPLTRAGVMFELSNAVAQRDAKRCLSLVEQLLKQGENAVGILLAAIAPTVRNLLLVKDLMQRHRLARPQHAGFFSGALNRLPQNALEHLPRKKDGSLNAYPLGVAALHAHRFQASELRALLDACLRANAHLVTTSADENVVLSELIAKVVGNG